MCYQHLIHTCYRNLIHTCYQNLIHVCNSQPRYRVLTRPEAKSAVVAVMRLEQELIFYESIFIDGPFSSIGIKVFFFFENLYASL